MRYLVGTAVGAGVAVILWSLSYVKNYWVSRHNRSIPAILQVPKRFFFISIISFVILGAVITAVLAP